MGTVRTTILLDADLLDRLERHVARQRTTKTAVIGAAIEAWLDANASSPDYPFVGIGRSAHGRLSVDGRSIVRRDAGRQTRGR